jgi:hypothetical protein
VRAPRAQLPFTGVSQHLLALLVLAGALIGAFGMLVQAAGQPLHRTRR